jgi:RNA polymerase sigma-70 factor, ECF subfamily
MEIDPDAEFQADLIALIPQMRAFARSLTGNRAAADDLAQEALLKAWRGHNSFARGTNLKAWTFMIVRNQFLSDKRRSWRSQPLDREVAEQTIASTDDPSGRLDVHDLRRAMLSLPEDQREALTLIGAAGLSYEDAAAVCQIAVGTVKSRVSRARAALRSMLADGVLVASDVPADQAADAILHEARVLAGAAINTPSTLPTVE